MAGVIFSSTSLMGTMPLATVEGVVKVWEMRGLGGGPRTVRIVVQILADLNHEKIRPILDNVSCLLSKNWEISKVFYYYQNSKVGELFITFKDNYKQEDVDSYLKGIAEIVNKSVD